MCSFISFACHSEYSHQYNQNPCLSQFFYSDKLELRSLPILFFFLFNVLGAKAYYFRRHELVIFEGWGVVEPIPHHVTVIKIVDNEFDFLM